MLPQIFKSTVKKVLGIDSQSGVEPIQNLHKVGSNYHGYFIPADFLKSDSICYCIGAGEDISFDTELKILYDAQIYIFDPAPEGIEHFKKLVDVTARGEQLSIGKKQPFTYRINAAQLSQITYIDVGVWEKEAILKFYEPDLENYVSHSVHLFKDSGKFIEAPVDRLKNLMKKQNHSAVDLVKIEIEGAEYTVIDTIIEDKLDIKVILVEFDEVYHMKGFKHLFRIKNSTNKLRKAGYVLAHSTDHYKRLFVRRDVCHQLGKN
ncbi:MAG: FkbM family methyltransferase [Bacteroidetes bacterium]|nr:FkbM family methyltransferase [Bacteroidota bacterium]